MRRRALVCSLGYLVIGAVSACDRAPIEAAPPKLAPAANQPSLEFSFVTTDRARLDSYQTRGRPTALLFVTTYDWASQVLAQRLSEVTLRHRPRINAGAIVLETAEYQTMAQVFRSSLHLPYPVAMADDATREGKGPFGPIPRIPTLVILDREGREVWRQAGVVEIREIHEFLDRAAQSGALRSAGTGRSDPGNSVPGSSERPAGGGGS